jgi:tagaturonate reductase
MTPVAYLYGLETVEETVNHPVVGSFIKNMIQDEIIPTLDGPKDELSAFAQEVLSRFINPYIKHYLLSISLNSISKFTARNLPALLDYVKLKQELPEKIVFSLSSLLYFYKGNRDREEIPLQDSPEVLEFFKTQWQRYDQQEVNMQQLADTFLSNQKLWGMDLAKISGLSNAVAANLEKIAKLGIREAINHK